MHLPYNTHKWLLGPVTGQEHVNVQLCLKTLRFINNMLNSHNEVVSFVSHVAASNANSPIGRNVAILRYKYNVDFVYSSLSHNIALVKNLHSLNLQQQGLVNNFCDLLLVKNGYKCIEHFDSEMINVLINSIACD